MNKIPTKSHLLLITFIILLNHISNNRYTGLNQRFETSSRGSFYFQYNSYYYSMKYYKFQPDRPRNFFREIILPFTSETYRILTTQGNTFFESTNIDPIRIYTLWEDSDLSNTYHFLEYITNSHKTAVYHICNQNDKCYNLQIEEDPQKYTVNAWKEMAHMRKENFIIHLRKTLYQDSILFGVFQFAPTTLHDLIHQKALKELHVINLVDDLLTMTQNYMKYKIIHGDIRPTKILTLIDPKIRKPFKYQLKWHKMVNHHSEIDPMLSGFKKFARVFNSKEEVYPEEMYEQGTGVVDMTDINEVKKPKIMRYETRFRPYEVWAYRYKKFSPGSDIFALGITLFHIIQGQGPESLEHGCLEKSLVECENQFFELENEIKNEISHSYGWERCVWYLISKMTSFSPLERISPKNAKKDFIKCLHKLDFEFEEPPKV